MSNTCLESYKVIIGSKVKISKNLSIKEIELHCSVTLLVPTMQLRNFHRSPNEICTTIPLILPALQSSVLELVDYSSGKIYIEVQSQVLKVGDSVDSSKEFHFGCMYNLG